MTIKVTSRAFKDGGPIPRQYTCDGPDVSPPLAWGPVPGGAKTVALIADDPDAPVGTWVHWVLYDLPAKVNELPEKVPPDKKLSLGGVHGTNDFKRIGYGGPCPPSGTHRYYFKIYALDRGLNLGPGATKQQLLQAMEGNVLDQGQIMGTYKRS